MNSQKLLEVKHTSSAFVPDVKNSKPCPISRKERCSICRRELQWSYTSANPHGTYSGVHPWCLARMIGGGR